MLYLMACGVNRIRPADTCTMLYEKNKQKIDELYMLCKAHFVDALVGSVLKQSGVNVGNTWNEAIAKSIRKVVLFDAERAQILSYMESRGIWHLPLKGIIMKELYPSVGMRQMSDNDILFDAYYSDTMHDYMVARGYEAESFGMGNHDVYKKAPVYNFELHRALYGSTGRKEWVDYYSDVKNDLFMMRIHHTDIICGTRISMCISPAMLISITAEVEQESEHCWISMCILYHILIWIWNT